MESSVVLKALETKQVIACLGAAANLGVAEALESGPKTLEELAEATKSHAESLFRILRLLEANGVFKRGEDGKWANNDQSLILSSNHPQSLKHMVSFYTTHLWNIFSDLTYTVQTGKSAFVKQNGMPIFDWMEKHPEVFSIFNAAMTNYSMLDTKLALEKIDFSPYKLVADIGGGHGYLLTQVLLANPHLKGIVFDLESVVSKAAETNKQLDEVKSRLEFQGGSFFETVPKDCDLYIMKHIIHDWGDEDCIRMLKVIRKNIAKGGVLIVMDHVLPDDNKPHPAKTLDLTMLTVFGNAKERTEKQMSELLEKGGFRVTKVIPERIIGFTFAQPIDE